MEATRACHRLATELRLPGRCGDRQVFAANEQSDRPVDLARLVASPSEYLRPRHQRRASCHSCLSTRRHRRSQRKIPRRKGPTDVLSFPIEDELIGPGHVPDQEASGPAAARRARDMPLLIGDVVICRRGPGSRQPSTQWPTRMSSPAARAWILHLLGMDHEEDTEAAMMEALEQRLLAPTIANRARIHDAGHDAELHRRRRRPVGNGLHPDCRLGGPLARGDRPHSNLTGPRQVPRGREPGAHGRSAARRGAEAFLAPILLLVLLCQLVAATLVGVIAAQVFGPIGVAVATAFEVV